MINWAIMGTGKMAKTFANAIKNSSNCNLIAVSSNSEKRAAEFAKQFNIKNHFGSHDQLASFVSIDVIYIATTNNFHKENALVALDNDKAILIEKPFAINADETEEILNRAKEKQLFCMEAMWTRFIPIVQKVKAIIEKGTIGNIKMINASFGIKATFDPQSRLFNPQLGGGATLDLLVYPISICQYLLGKPQAITSAAQLSSTGVDINTSVILNYSEAIINLQTSLVTHLSNDFIIYGEKGNIHINTPLYRPYQLQLSTTKKVIATKSIKKAIKDKLKNNKLARNIAFKFLPKNNFQNTETIKIPFIGSGYEHEIQEVMFCLHNNQVSSKIMSWTDSKEVMQILDTIRLQQNISIANNSSIL